MNKRNSIKAFNRINLIAQTKFTLSEVSNAERYFNQEIKGRKSNSKRLSKYVAAFDYIDKNLIVLSKASGGASIISLTTVIGAPAAISSATFSLVFSLATQIIKKLLSKTINKQKKHDKIFVLAKSKLNNVETLVSQALTDLKISHTQFIAILKEKEKYERMKENLINILTAEI